jgi:hypothetical protein
MDIDFKNEKSMKRIKTKFQVKSDSTQNTVPTVL